MKVKVNKSGAVYNHTKRLIIKLGKDKILALYKENDEIPQQFLRELLAYFLSRDEDFKIYLKQQEYCNMAIDEMMLSILKELQIILLKGTK